VIVSVISFFLGLFAGCALTTYMLRSLAVDFLVKNSFKKVTWNPEILGYRTVKVLSAGDIDSAKLRGGDSFLVTLSKRRGK
jgi:hypothetical protein